MKSLRAVTGVFSFPAEVVAAIGKIRSARLRFQVYSPFACPEIDAAALPAAGTSPVTKVTFSGAIAGLIAGFALAILCCMDWPLRVSAKAIVSPPAYVVIGYEMLILLGGLATLMAVLYFCRLPNMLRKIGYDPRFSNDKFGLVVECESEQVQMVEHTLRGCGAEEVEVKPAL